MFGIKRRFQGCKAWSLGSRSPPYEHIKFGYPLENVRFLLLPTNLAWEWLQIDTDLLQIITTTADELSRGTNIDDLERPWTPKIGVFSEFLAILGCDAHLEWIFAEIKLMLSRVSWALAQISCWNRWNSTWAGWTSLMSRQPQCQSSKELQAEAEIVSEYQTLK